VSRYANCQKITSNAVRTPVVVQTLVCNVVNYMEVGRPRRRHHVKGSKRLWFLKKPKRAGASAEDLFWKIRLSGLELESHKRAN